MCSTWIALTMPLELLQRGLSEVFLCFKEAAFYPPHCFLPSHYVGDSWACASRTGSMFSETRGQHSIVWIKGMPLEPGVRVFQFQPLVAV